MKKINMLKKNYEFKTVLKKGKYYKGKQIDILVLKNNKKYNLLGIAISKKTGKSVTRNRIKRLIRENYRLLQNNFNTGYSIVILWNKNALGKEADFYLIKKDMEKILKMADVLEKE